MYTLWWLPIYYVTCRILLNDPRIDILFLLQIGCVNIETRKLLNFFVEFVIVQYISNILFGIKTVSLLFKFSQDYVYITVY